MPITNAFDVPRSKLLDSLAAMRKQIFQVCLDYQKQQSPQLLAEGEFPKPLSPFLPSGAFDEVNSALMRNDSLEKPKVLDSAHSVPISLMGQYQGAMAKQQAQEFRDPLVDEETLRFLRKNMFGNPYSRMAKNRRLPPPNAAVTSKNKTNISRKPNTSEQKNTQGVDSTGETDAEAALAQSVLEEVEDMAIELSLNENIDTIDTPEITNPRLNWAQQHKRVPRYRTLVGSWEPGDMSWNVNPWSFKRSSSTKDLESVEMALPAFKGSAAANNLSSVIPDSSTQKPDSSNYSSSPAVPFPSKPAETGTTGIPSSLKHSPTTDSLLGSDNLGTFALDILKQATAKSRQKTPTAMKAFLIKEIKMEAKSYNEKLILETLEQLKPDSKSTNYTNDQKKSIVNACLNTAKQLRKHNLVSFLESLSPLF
ncbi:hypothetical protein AX774_g4192 [Zancudomyces culisetae]|uniref:Uncharacterized protein n=1 Tax=Zancudomyces culisetae TaxID=1213189 RepID=A0A1R1PG25_ZANCU|nr:hypothetical protein AX774_g6701 [Zancudomyces culisetae]OMH82328.1 hypothetical protein AX774_g4192 [Zancudomyces culisetae]|eukprot:OMH79873.1 hypothetical protein AX774_g6701 [Zancudomyces culisetae]